ncbi:MAG: hypothetical protein N3D16_02945 [Anaerolineales bacterium]|nr:hypothetical protein [Anaerolineales bacterium]
MSKKPVFWVWLLAALVLMAILNWLNAPLVNPTAPWGVFSWQLAGSSQRTLAILAAWDARTQLLAAFGLGLDYLFMLIYAVTLNLACRWSAEKLGRADWGAWLGSLVYLAVLLDALENACLFIGLIGKPVSPYPEVAAISAGVKFTLISLALTWILLGGLVAVGQKARNFSG